MTLETIRLQLFDQEQEISVEEALDSKSSAHTGGELRCVRVGFDVEAARSSEMNTLLAGARNPERAIQGADGARWMVLSSSYSYQQDSPIHRFQVELQEAEPLAKAERVEMLGLSLVPSKYKEEVLDDGVLLISLLVNPTATDDATLAEAIEKHRANEMHFDAVRVGVSDQPLSVRFGRCLWKQQEDGPPFRLLRLVADRDSDDRDDSSWLRMNQPELARAQEKIAALEDIISGLIKRLRESGVIEDATAQAIEREADGSWERHINDFDEAVDIESYF